MMTFEEVKEMFKKSIDATDTMNQALEHLIQSIYLKGYNEALEQEPIAEERYQDLVEYFGDKDIAKCILEDREEFKKWLERIKWHVRKADELARKLEQEPRWIPVSERLPEEGEAVLTQAIFKDDLKMAVSSRTDYNYWTGWGTRDINIVAWMPLPQPYKTESEDEE